MIRAGRCRSGLTHLGYQNATVNIVSGRLGLQSGRSGRLYGTAQARAGAKVNGGIILIG